MSRKPAGSPAGPELKRRYLAGGGLAALGLLLMLAAFHPPTSDRVMQWVSSTHLAIARCPSLYQQWRQWASPTYCPISTAFMETCFQRIMAVTVYKVASSYAFPIGSGRAGLGPGGNGARACPQSGC